jgi:hypothetical protein
MSSCQKRLSDAELQDEVKKEREGEILTASKIFIRDVVINMCALEGISGHIDSAFGIDRGKIIAEALKEVAKELEEERE